MGRFPAHAVIVEARTAAHLPLCRSVSIGVATLAFEETLANLMARADAALYVAKAEGRNRVVGAPMPPCTAAAPSRSDWR